MTLTVIQSRRFSFAVDVSPVRHHVEYGSNRFTENRISRFAFYHKRYTTLGDDDKRPDHNAAADEAGKSYAARKVYMLDHSGLSVAAVPMYMGFDSGLLGFAYVMPQDVRSIDALGKTYYPSRARVLARIDEEVRKLDCVLNGNVAQATIYKSAQRFTANACPPFCELEEVDYTWAWYGPALYSNRKNDKSGLWAHVANVIRENSAM